MFTNKKLQLRALIFIVLIGAFHFAMTAGIPTAFAQGVPPTPVELQKTFMTVLSMITTFMQVLLLVILDMVGYLMRGDFFTDGNMMGALNNIWKLSRNIMNIIFAVMLIGVAFYTIITAKAEMIKGKWAQFVIAVVLVNFSWFFPRVVMDVANVMTATVYSVPGMLGLSACQNFEGEPCKIIVKIRILPSLSQTQDFYDIVCGGSMMAPDCHCREGIGCDKKALQSSAAANNMNVAHATLNGMAVSFIHIEKLTQIPPQIFGGGGAGVFQNTLKIMINVMMVFFVQIGIVLPIIALGVGLFIRILILWVSIAFMPFVFLGYVISGKLGTNIFGFETDLWKEFINAAFLPTVVAIPFVIGFIMLQTMATVPAPAGFNQDWGIPLIQGVGSWWGFLWLFAAVGIIYTGAFAALRRSAITGKITDKIKGFGDMAFGAAVQLPLLTPLPMPIAGTSIKNLGGILNAPGNIAQDIKLRARGIDPRGGGGDVPRALGAEPNSVNEINTRARENTQDIVRAITGLTRANFGTAEFKTSLEILQKKVGGDNLPPEVMLKKFRDIVASDPNHPLANQLNAIQNIVTKVQQGSAQPPPPQPPPAQQP